MTVPANLTPVHPLDIANCEMYFTGDNFQSITTTGTAIGSTWNDSSGRTQGGTQATTSKQPLLGFPGLGGAPHVTFNGTTGYVDLGVPANLLAMTNGNTQGFTLVFAVNSGSLPASYQTLFAKTAGGGGRVWCMIDNTGKFFRYGSAAFQQLLPNLPYVLVYQFQPTSASTGTETVWVNGRLCGTAAASAGVTTDTTSNYTIGSVAGGTNFYAACDIYDIAGYSRILTQAEILSLSNYLLVKMGAGTSLIVCGNSISAGTGASVTSLCYANRLAGELQTSFYLNNAYPGQTWGAVINDAKLLPAIGTTQGTYYLACPASTWSVLVMWEGTNTVGNLITGGATQAVAAATAFTDAQSACGLARQAGYNAIFVATIPPFNSAYETGRQIYNTTIRANYSTFADGLIDFAADPQIGNNSCLNQISGGSNENPLYFGSIHPNNFGHARMANIAAAAIRKWMKGNLRGNTNG